MDILQFVQPHILTLKPYSSARLEFSDKKADIFLDANENPFNNLIYNRYPDPLQKKIKTYLSTIKEVSPNNIFCGNGSDEAIDILIRIFCTPQKDNIVITTPTYGIYEVYANTANVGIIKHLLKDDFSLPIKKILQDTDKSSKILFINNPNNPTGNLFKHADITLLIKKFKGIVVIDEAYVDFTNTKSFISLLTKYQNLVVIQTLSKAYGLAGLRFGLLYGHEKIIQLMNKVKAPYNINSFTQNYVLSALKKTTQHNNFVNKIVEQRKYLTQELKKVKCIVKVYPSETNYILVKTQDANSIYNYLLKNQIVIRNRTKDPLCENCVRISVGTKDENNKLLKVLANYKN